MPEKVALEIILSKGKEHIEAAILEPGGQG